MSKTKLALAPGTVVQGTNMKYTVDHVLGTGAFGITYLATTKITMNSDFGAKEIFVLVTLKEFFVEGRMTRNGNDVVRDETDEELNRFARCFYMEAEKMSTLDHPNIVKALEVFVTNRTCYYTMEYLHGGSLNEYIAKKNGLSEAEALKYTREIGSALAYMHDKKMIHLDVKPANMVFDWNKTLKLIDYGLSIQYDNNGEPEATDGFCSGTPGYAPLEQSQVDAANRFNPHMDVYGLGASYYKMLTGVIPRKAIEVVHFGIDTHPLVSKHVSQQSIDAIKAAMNPKAEERLQTIDEFLAMLPDIKEEAIEKENKENIWGNHLILIGVGLIAIALICFLMFM